MRIYLVRIYLIAFLLFSLNLENQAQSILFTDPGQSHNNTDATTMDTYGPVNVSGCSSVIFAIDYESSAGWAGSGNMESISECGACSGDPLNQSSDCATCWDFFYVEFLFDGNVVGTELVGAGFDVQTASFNFPICTDGATTASMQVYTQTWASAETISFSNIEISCNELGSVVSSATVCNGDPMNLEIDYPDLGVINSTNWSSDGSANILASNAAATSATGVVDGEVFTVSTEDNNGCVYEEEIIATVGTGGNAGTDGVVSLCSESLPINLFDELGGTPDAGGIWSGPSVLSGGDLGTFSPFTDQSGIYTYTITGGSCGSSTATVDVSVSSCCTNLVVREMDSFENNNVIPDLIPGTTYGNTPQTYVAHDGSNSVYMDFVNGFAGLVYDRTYDACIDQTYQFSAWFHNTWGGATDVDLDLKVLDGNGNVIYEETSFPVGGTWVQFVTPSFISPSNVIRFQLYTNIPGGVGNNDCSMDELVLQECEVPVLGLDITDVCTGSAPFNLFDSITNPYSNTGLWSGPTVTTNGYQGTLEPSLAQNGIYSYTVSGPGACPDSIVEINTSFLSAGNPGIDGAISICSNNGVYDLYNLLGGSPDNGGTWSGPSVLTNGDLGTYTANNNQIGTYTYTVGSSASCASSADVTVSNNGVEVDLGNDTTLCENESLLLDAGGGFDIYEWQDGSNAQTYDVTSAGTYWVEISSIGSNVIQNGDFEQGDNFFTTDYTLGSGGAWGQLSNESTYAVNTNPNNVHIDFNSCSDHTSSAGNALIVNGSDMANTSVWCQNVAVEPSTDYYFSTWVSSVMPSQDIAELQFSIDGSALGQVFSPLTTGCDWLEFSETWNSGALTNVEICIVNQNTSTGGNDFMIDDIYFAPLCVDRDSIVIDIETLPNPGEDNTVDLCGGQTTIDLFGELIGTPDLGGTWSPSLSSGTGVFDVALDPIVIYSYTVSGSVCPDSSATIELLTTTSADAGTNGSVDICAEGASINLFDYLGGNPDAGGSWSPNLNSGTDLFDPALDISGAYIYSIGGTAACAPATAEVEVNVIPNENPVIQDPGSLCVNGGDIIMSSSVGGGEWSGMTINQQTGLFSPSNAGVGTWEITYESNGQCPGNDTIDLEVFGIPQANIFVSDTIGCAPLEVNIENSIVGNNVSCEWDLGDGETISSCIPFTYQFENEGCFDVSLILTDQNGCSESFIASSPICVQADPEAYFSYAPETPDELNPIIELTNESSGAVGYEWFMDGVSISVDQHTEYNFSKDTIGQHIVCLAASSLLGCADTLCQEVQYEEVFNFYVPTAFSPNRNGVNDLFYPVISGPMPVFYEFRIFNRWGQVIFSTSDPYEAWDGTFQSEQVQQDVYVWKCYYRHEGVADISEIIGNVSVVR